MNDLNSQGRLDPTGGVPANGQLSQDQGSGQAGSNNPKPNDPVVEIDGERIPVSEVKAGIMRQKDYTKKTQELADERRHLEEERQAFSNSHQPQTPPQEDPNAELKEGVEAIKKIGNLATADEVDQKLNTFQLAQEDERSFQKTLSSDERLKGNEDLLRDLGKANPQMAWEDIVEKYGNTLKGVNPEDEAARNQEVVGNPNYVKSEKNILDMTEQEWEDHKAQRGGSGRAFEGKFKRQEKPSAHPNL